MQTYIGGTFPFQTSVLQYGIPTNADADTATVTIFPPVGLSFSLPLNNVGTGLYLLDWVVPSLSPVGIWRFVYNAEINGIPIDTGFYAFTVTATQVIIPSGDGYCVIQDILNRIQNLTQTVAQETPAGPINGMNTLYTLAHTPMQMVSLQLGGVNLASDLFSLAGFNLTMVSAPTSGQVPFLASYTYPVKPLNVIQDLIDRGGSFIDSYLCNRYTVPLAPPFPFIIVQLNVDLVASALYQEVHEGDGTTEELPMHKVLYNQALTQLMRLKNGEINLPGLSQSIPAMNSALLQTRIVPALMQWNPIAGTRWRGNSYGGGNYGPGCNW